MATKTNCKIRFTRKMKMEEILDDPLNEEVYGLFLQVKDSPRHIAIKAESLFNEVYYICSKFYQDNNPVEHLSFYVQEIESDLGWHYADDLVMPIAYVVLGSRKRIPLKIKMLMDAIKENYQPVEYWKVFCEREYKSLKNNSNKTKIIDLNELAKRCDKTIIIQVADAKISVNTSGNIIGKTINYGK